LRRESGVREGIRSVTQVPSWLYQRYSQVWRHAALSAGWAVLYVWLDTSLAQYGELEGSTFPVQWRVFLAACILVGGLWKPVVGYALFVAAIAYPLYLISVYVMALSLAVLILTAPLAARHLPLALMVIAAPLVAPIHLTPVLPFLFGLLSSTASPGDWDRANATVAGGLCALWLKICAGMSGHTTDLWYVNGWSPQVAPVYERYHTANSLQTLVQLVEPLTASVEGSAATVLLFNLLQVCAWACAAYLVGAIRDVLLLRKMGSAGRGSAWTSVLSLVPGIVVIWAGYVAVPSWLQVPGPRWLDPLWLPAQVVLAAAVAIGVDGLLRYLRQPLLARQRPVRVAVPAAALRRQKKRPPSGPQVRSRGRPEQGRKARIIGSAEAQPTVAGDQRTGGDSPASRGRREDEDDIIMIELD
jgi:hypothetical protein